MTAWSVPVATRLALQAEVEGDTNVVTTRVVAHLLLNSNSGRWHGIVDQVELDPLRDTCG